MLKKKFQGRVVTDYLRKNVAWLVIAGMSAAGILTLLLTSAATTTVSINDNVVGSGINQWQYAGTGWQHYTGEPNKYMGDDHSSSVAGDTATLRFSGTRVAFHGAKSPQAGIVAISVDGAAEVLVDLYSATRYDDALIYTSPELPDGDHSLRIRLTGTKNASAIAAAAAVDRAIITVPANSTGFASLEAEAGGRSSGAAEVMDTSASAGKAVRFGSAPAVSSGLPRKIVGGYWQMWQGPHVSEITASAPQYNLQYASFAMGNAAGRGSVSFNPVFSTPDRLKTDMAASQAAGSHWVLSIGGGADKTVRLLNETNAIEMFNSLKPIIDHYGFNGVDFDLECGTSCIDPASMASVGNKLKAHYGSRFVISMAPRPYEAYLYRPAALQLGANLDLYGYQFYDYPEARDPVFQKDWIRKYINESVAAGIPPSKLMIGCITYTQYSMGWSPLSLYQEIFDELEAKYPELRGVYVWETSLDKKEGWNFAKGMGWTVLQ